MRNFIDIVESRIDKEMFKKETVKLVADKAQDRFETQKPNFSVMGEISDSQNVVYKVWGKDDGGDVRLYAGNKEDRCVGYILLRQLSPDWPDMKQVSMAFVLPKFTKRGIAKSLYMFAMSKGYALVSDRVLTTASKAIWQSMMNDRRVTVTMTHDINDMHEEPLDNIQKAFRNPDRRMVARLT